MDCSRSMSRLRPPPPFPSFFFFSPFSLSFPLPTPHSVPNSRRQTSSSDVRHHQIRTEPRTAHPDCFLACCRRRPRLSESLAPVTNHASLLPEIEQKLSASSRNASRSPAFPYLIPRIRARRRPRWAFGMPGDRPLLDISARANRARKAKATPARSCARFACGLARAASNCSRQ